MGLEINEGPGPAKRARRQAAPPLSEQIKAAAAKIEHATDAAGRVIGVRRLGPVDLFDLTLALGAEVSANQSAMMQIMNVCSVCEIDGEPVPKPATLLQVKALMQRLDFHGMAAAQEGLKRFLDPGEEGIEAAKN